jgi:hypothetical protein
MTFLMTWVILRIRGAVLALVVDAGIHAAGGLMQGRGPDFDMRFICDYAARIERNLMKLPLIFQ